MKVFLYLLLDNKIINLQLVIQYVLTKHYDSLHESSRNNLLRLADEMYAADLISSNTQRSLSFDVIIKEFKEGMSLKMAVSKIEQHCAMFLSVLTKIGGPCAVASETLQHDLIEESRPECGIELQLGM